MAGVNYTLSTAGSIDPRLGNRVFFSKLGDPMAYDECSKEASTCTPVQEEVNHLTYQIKQYLHTQARTQELLRIARAKLAAVKALGK